MSTPAVVPYDFRVCKICSRPDGRPTFKLPRVTVFVCGSCNFHYGNVLAPALDDTEVSSDALTDEHRAYIENVLHSNPRRFQDQIEAVERYGGFKDKRLLDAGCGAGMFLSLARERGASVVGLDMSDARIVYGRQHYGLDIRKSSLEDAVWKPGEDRFDVVTMWDVLEHVSFPVDFVKAAARLLSHGGYLLVDTPRREAFLHRFGTWSYRMTGGRWAAFLPGMYSDWPNGHKQILSSEDVRRILQKAGLELVRLEPFKELSFPIEGYLRKFFRVRWAVNLLRPIAALGWKAFPLKNKMLVVARKPA